MSSRIAFSVFLLGLLLSVLFYFFPVIDVWVSQLFYNPGFNFTLRYSVPAHAMRTAINHDITLLMILLSVGFLGRFFFYSMKFPVPPKLCLYLVLCFLLGPGLIINGVLKNHWGRPRPTQVIYFNGEKPFESAWVMSTECDSNCSFVSGDVAGIIGLIGLVEFSRRKKQFVLAILGASAVIGIARIAEGGHFLSDILLAAVITYLISWVLYWFMYACDFSWLSDEAFERYYVWVYERFRKKIKPAGDV